MKIGIFGLPSSGKTTLWCLLTENFEGPDPAQAGKLQLRTVKVHDSRLERLRDDYQPRKYTPATLEVGDFPAVAASAGKDRAGLEQLLAPARPMDAFLIVLRGFEDAASAGGGSADPVREWEEIEAELLLSDLAVVERRVEKLRVQVKKPTPTQASDRRELELLERLLPHLEAEKPARDFELNADEAKLLGGFQFLSAKPLVPVLNRGESPAPAEQLQELARRIGREVFEIAAQNELEILQLPPDDQELFRQEYGIEPGVRDRIIAECYRAADRISFFTAGEKEVRAWTIRRGEPAVEAAGEIHTDIARGFIRAETVSFDDYVRFGSVKAARDKGHLRLEGKEYTVQDGDIIEFRFSV